MKIKYYLKDKELGLAFRGLTIAAYNNKMDTAMFCLPRIWKACYMNVDEFTTQLASSLSHETIHREVRREMEVSNINLGIMPITSQEWITKKLNSEEMNELTLIPNVYHDVMYNYLEKNILKSAKELEHWNLMRNIMYIVMVMWMIFLILISVRTLIS